MTIFLLSGLVLLALVSWLRPTTGRSESAGGRWADRDTERVSADLAAIAAHTPAPTADPNVPADGTHRV